MNTKFERLDEPYLYGYGAYRDDGIRVEVVRCYEGEWSVFLTRNSEVCARSIEEHQLFGNGLPESRCARRYGSNDRQGFLVPARITSARKQ